MIRHHGESKRREYTHSFDKKILGRCHTNWVESFFQYWEEDWERFLVWGLIALPPLQKIQNKIWNLPKKDADKELSDIRAIRRHSAEIIISSRPMNYVMFHHMGGDTHRRMCHTKKGWHTNGVHTLCIWKGDTHTPMSYMDQARDQYYVAKAGLVTEEKSKEENHIIFFTNNDADEAEEFTDLKKPRKVTCQILWISEQNAEYWIHLSATQERNLADSVYAIILYQSMLKECVVQVVNKSEDEDYSQDNLCLERTSSNTPKYLGSWRLRRLVQFLGSRDQNCKGETSTQFYQKVAIGPTRNYKDENYMQKTHTRTTVWVRRPRRKVMKQAIASCIRQNLSNSLQTPTWYPKECDGEVYILKENDRWVGCTNALTQLVITLRDGSELRFKISTQRHHRDSEQKRASGHREELTHTSDDWWKAK